MSFCPTHVRIRPSCAWRLAAAVFALPAILVVFSAGQLRAAEINVIQHGAPVRAVEAPSAQAGGLPDGALASSITFVDQAGQRVLLGHDGENLTVEPAAPRVAPAPRLGLLPDGEIMRGAKNIAEAWLIGPTDRYPHGILGDAIEAAGIMALGADGRIHQLVLDGESVFEDRRVRIVDLDNDGVEELIVVRSYLDRGAALSVLRIDRNGLGVVAETPPIGTARRWLNPVGAGDFDGDGIIEIAYVETPHIGGVLTLYEFDQDSLTRDYGEQGFSNHAIRTAEQGLATLVDWNRDGVVDLAVPSADRRAMRLVTFAEGRMNEFERIALAAPIATTTIATDLDSDTVPELVFALGDGTLVWMHADQ